MAENYKQYIIWKKLTQIELTHSKKISDLKNKLLELVLSKP